MPAFFVGCYTGDWDEAGYATQRFAEAYVHPPMPDERYPWVQYNSWKYGQEIDEAQQLAVLERCAALGIEVAILDLGWARTIGDWRPNPAKFPRGLRPIADRAHELGMKFGVHVAIAQMAPDAPAALAHPEWLAFHRQRLLRRRGHLPGPPALPRMADRCRSCGWSARSISTTSSRTAKMW
jgi:alpha-galactosidase